MNPWLTAVLLVWQTILAFFSPLALALPNIVRGPGRGDWIVLGCYFVGILLILPLLAAFTPRRWWLQPTLLGIAAVLLGGAIAGSGVLVAGQILAPAWFGDAVAVLPLAKAIEERRTASPQAPAWQAGAEYRTRQKLNLRSAPGVDGELVAVLPSDATVKSSGPRQGDWWRVKAGDKEGWVSSLWLVRPEG